MKRRRRTAFSGCSPKHRGLIDAELAFNTDGGGVRLRNGRPAVFEVQASEKIYADYQLEVTDVGGPQLACPARAIRSTRWPPRSRGSATISSRCTSTTSTRMFLERSSATESGQTAIDMRAVAAVPPDPAAAARLSRAPIYNAQLRTTCVATKVEAGHANNALPQLARAVVNCRILPGTARRRRRDGHPQARRRESEGDGLEPPIASPPSTLDAALSVAPRTARRAALAGDSGHSDDAGGRDRRDVHAKQRHSHLRRLGDRHEILTTCARMGKTSGSASSRFTRPRSSGSSS